MAWWEVPVRVIYESDVVVEADSPEEAIEVAKALDKDSDEIRENVLDSYPEFEILINGEPVPHE